MSPVHRLVWRLALITFGVSTLLVGIVIYSGRVMDAASVANQSALIENAFSTRLVRANSELRSVAWWDEAVFKSSSQGFDADWLDLEVGAFMTQSFGHNAIVILDEAEKPVYAFTKDGRTPSADLTYLPGAIRPLIAQVRGGRNVSPRFIDRNLLLETSFSPDLSDRKTGRSAGAVARIDGKPALVSVMAITPSVNAGLRRARPRLLVSIVDIDQVFLNEVAANALLKKLRFAPSNSPGPVSLRFDADDGAPLGHLSWSTRKPGSDMVQKVMPWILLCLAMASAAMALLMIKLNQLTMQLAVREQEARTLADYDTLTGLPNRLMLETLYNEMMMSGVSGTQRILIACVDLDRFKDINDTLGHHWGDELIKAVALRLRSRLGSDDTLARIGGDEFAIMRAIPWMSDVDQLSEIVAQCFWEPFDVHGHHIESNASVGIAFAERHDSFDQSIKRADIALYDAKANGRGRSSRFTVAMSQSLEKRHALEVDLKRALAADELELHYQPVVEARSGAISSLEALLRWTSPVHGPVAPDVFIPIAEEAGLMADLGRFVIDRAFSDARRWPELETAINISPAQLRSATIVADLLGAATRYKVPATQITIEITETVLMSNDERTLRVLSKVKEEGFGLTLDDFGTGYSSLAYLRDFPFDKLKIDRGFVKGLSVNDRALAIVKAVVNFGRILGHEIVAEGIETEQEMQAMQAAGCTHLQGWLFSKALPADHIEALAVTFGRLSARREIAGESAAVAVHGRRKAPLPRARRRA